MASYNNTKHREEIISLFKTHHLLTANEIKEALPNIDTVTIYRTLKRLTDAGIVKEVKHSTKFASFELNTDHQHFECTVCKKVFPIEIDAKKLAAAVQTSEGKIQTIHVDVTGICNTCITLQK